MGLGEEVKKEAEAVEEKLLHDIVEHLPLFPDKARQRASV
jgi:hypothetical protein